MQTAVQTDITKAAWIWNSMYQELYQKAKDDVCIMIHNEKTL